MSDKEWSKRVLGHIIYFSVLFGPLIVGVYWSYNLSYWWAFGALAIFVVIREAAHEYEEQSNKRHAEILEAIQELKDHIDLRWGSS